MSKKRLKPPSPSSLIDNFLFSQFSDPNSTEIQSLATDFAILDIQWTPHSELVGGDLLAVATSTGILAFYRLQQQQQQQEQPKLVLSHVQHITDDDTTLVLSLTWHPVRPGVLGLTLSDGRVCVCTSMGTSSGSGSGSTEEDDTAAGLWSQDAAVSLQDVHEHELEAWMMTFTPESLNVLSGGDDMVLQCSHVADDDGDDDGDDESEAEEEEEEQKEDQVEDKQHVQKTNKNKTNLLWQNRKLHHAGITAILPLSATLIITGSYDDHIRLLQLPQIPGDTRPKLLAELNLGGGVWRLKLLTTGRASSSSSSSSQRDDDSANAAENKSSSDSTVSALRRSSSCCRNSITRYALPSFCRCCYSTSTSTCPIHILFLSNLKIKIPCQPHQGWYQSVVQSAYLDCCCRDATRISFYFNFPSTKLN